MTKRFCDRCEKEIVGTSWIADVYKEDFLVQKICRSKHELCKECAEEVKAFLRDRLLFAALTEKEEKEDETMA